MKKQTLVLLSMLLTIPAFSQVWELDKAHAKLGFSVTHLLVSDVEGTFNSFDARISSSKDDFSDAVIELSADIASINTNNDQRDGHLKSPDFFDADKFSTLSFRSTSFKKVSDKHYRLIGDLTLHGITKTVELDVVLNGTAVHPYSKKTIAGFKVNGSIKRSDFAIGTSTPGAVVSDEIEITSNAEFIKG